MNGKNMQIADTPRKEARQYKHTPKNSKPVMAKILALCAVLALCLCMAVPCFANGWQLGYTDDIVTMHPYAPDYVSFFNKGVSSVYNISDSFPSGEKTAHGSNTVLFVKGKQLFLNQVTTYVEDDGQYLVTNISGSGNPDLEPPNTLLDVLFGWSEFRYIDTPPFDEFFTNELLTLRYSSTCCFKGDISITYHDPATQTRKTVSTPYTTEIIPGGASWSLSYILRDALHTFIPVQECLVYEMTATCTPYATADSELPMKGTQFTNAVVKSIVSTDDSVNPVTLGGVVYVVPPEVDTLGLFDWIVEGLDGLFHTPLIPIGDYSITIGSIVALFLGMSLVLAFLKFFAGG